MVESENYTNEYVDNNELNTQDYKYSNAFQWDSSQLEQGVAYDLTPCWWWCCWNPECEAHQRELVNRNIMVFLLFLLSVWIVSSAIAYTIFSFKKSEHPIRKALLWWIACVILAIILAIIYWTFFTR